jgi:dTMP kinase
MLHISFLIAYRFLRYQKKLPQTESGLKKSLKTISWNSWLLRQGIPTVTTREPGGTELGATLRSCLLDIDEAIAPQTELLLFAADRSHHIETVIKPSLAEGKIVLCDRFTDSTIAYQGSGRARNIDMINQLNQIATGGIQSDLTLWLDVDVEVGLTRAKKRKGDSDRIERESKEFHHRVKQGFNRLAKTNPRIHRIDGKLPVADVRDKVQKVVKQWLVYN